MLRILNAQQNHVDNCAESGGAMSQAFEGGDHCGRGSRRL
jgi:hypothetical protein